MIQQLEELFNRQARTWPLLAAGIAGLARAQTRRVRIDWFDVFVRRIPHRIASTTAQVDLESIAKRPCFLCAGNLPPEEEGIQFDNNFTIYCNPFPVVNHHLTISHREHRPQRIAHQFGSMLDLAAALPGYFVTYNGPECGASAPDHLHFQAGTRELFPIERDTKGLNGLIVPNYGRNVFVFRDRDRVALAGRLNHASALLEEISPGKTEPMVNLAAFHENGEWTAYVFPRRKHRPDVFYTGEVTVSPAAIDLCGIFVVPLARDFERITGETIAGIFREVTLSDGQFHAIAAKLEHKC
jgi:Domain of unknown function (DUF4922)